LTKIFYFPENAGRNKYITNSINIWKKCGYHVMPLNMAFNYVFEPNKTVILNWLEDVPSSAKNKFLVMLKCLFTIIFCAVFFKKIIYVKHNFEPHNCEQISSKLYFYFLSKMLELFATSIVTHRPCENLETKYINHPMYKLPENYHATATRDIEFSWVGKIMKYKGLDTLLLTWPKNRNLIISGKCDDADYAVLLNNIIKDRRLHVEWNNVDLSDLDLERLLLKTKYLILSHVQNSVIVSGMFYHAASLGCNILLSSGDFSNFCAKNFSFANFLESELRFVEHDLVIQEMKNKCSDNVLAEQWRLLL